MTILKILCSPRYPSRCKPASYLVSLMIILTNLLPILCYPTLTADPLHISRQVSSYQPINIPLNRTFSLKLPEPSIQYESLVEFHPTSVKLEKLKKVLLLQEQSQYDLLTDLRMPFTFEIREIVVTENYIMLYTFPNRITIIKEYANSFEVQGEYLIDEMELLRKAYLKLYKFHHGYVLAYCQASSAVFLLDEKGYRVIRNGGQIINLVHLHPFKSNQSNQEELEFFTAENTYGFRHAKINLQKNEIVTVQHFKDPEKQVQSTEDYEDSRSNLSSDLVQRLSVVDLNFDIFDDSEIFYLLNQKTGVHQVRYRKSSDSDAYQLIDQRLIIEQEGCESMDFLQNDRFVLVCSEGRYSFMVEAFLQQEQSDQNRVKSSGSEQGSISVMPPVYHNCNLEDLSITKDYYIAFDRGSIDIFWSRRDNYIPQLIHNKKHVNLRGLQAFRVTHSESEETFLYSVRSNILIKQKLVEEKSTLKIGSDAEIETDFTIRLLGSCQSILSGNQKHHHQFTGHLNQTEIGKISPSDTICEYEQPIELVVSEYFIDEDVRNSLSLAIGLTAVTASIGFVLVCICMKKYQTLERQAKEAVKKLRDEESARTGSHFTLN